MVFMFSIVDTAVMETFKRTEIRNSFRFSRHLFPYVNVEDSVILFLYFEIRNNFKFFKKMSENISSAEVAATQKALSKYIKKPVLTEKLLKRPPFRFLHDIVTSVIKETGFFKGLYEDNELDSNKVKDKEAKIAFMDKLIAALKEITGEDIQARSGKIVAGLEVDKTLKLLQLMARALDKKKHSDENLKPEKPVVAPKKLENLKKDPNDQGNTKTDKKIENKSLIPKTTKQTDNLKPVNQDLKSNVAKTNKDNLKPNKGTNVKKPSNITKGEAIINPTRTTKIDTNRKQPEIKPEISKKGVQNKENKSSPKRNSVSETKPVISNYTEIDKDNDQNETQSSQVVGERATNEIPEKTIRPRSARPGSRKHVAGNEIQTTTQNEVKSVIARPGTATIRPGSSRPGAPRVKDRGEIPVVDDQEPVKSVNVIADTVDNDDLDDENIVVVESEVKPSSTTLEEITAPDSQGKLVSQILETQKKLENVPQENSESNNEMRLKERETTLKEMQDMQKSIQAVTSAANPLGKLIEFLQEDMDEMQKELQHWMDLQEHLYKQQLANELEAVSITQPLDRQLETMEVAIEEERSRIRNVKSQILTDEENLYKTIINK